MTNTLLRRIYLLFFVVVSLFSILVFRLAQMQLVNRSFYDDKLTASTTYTVTTSSPRGQIYDAKGQALVGNTVKEAISFTRSNTMTAQDIKEIAQRLASYVTLTETKVTDRAKRDYYLVDEARFKEVVEQLPDDQKYDQLGNNLTTATVYNNAIAAVPEEAVNYSEEELKIIYIFNQMNAAGTFDTVFLTTGDLSPEQIAYVTANKAKLDGIAVRTNWQRQDIATSLSSIIGRVSTEQTGLPQEEADDYLKKGYALNDRVGTSYLEKQYEEVLQGSRTVRTVTVDKKGSILSDTVDQQGEKGNNIKLTIDLAFQEGVENILRDYYNAELAKGNVANSEGVYAVALNPETGAILAMAGLAHDTKTNELTTDALGTITKVFTPGSVVKGATLSAGWENGVIAGNQTLYDQQIDTIKSWFTDLAGGSMPITATQSLEYSSNTYMVQVALKLAGQDGMTEDLLKESVYQRAMEKLRTSYAQYGLGVATGIDLPSESTGFIPKDYSLANVMTEAFGQFDNYTTMQLAQYVATVANGGKRQAPHLVEGIYANDASGGLGALIKPIEPQTLNQVGISSDEMALIQNGFYNVVNGGGAFTTGREIGYGASVAISAKTGTAEAYVTDEAGNSIYTSNLNVVAYGPSDDPQIAVAVVLPHSTDLTGKTSHHIVRDIINLYMSRRGQD
ncbi:penicillin-binding protein PBP2B [Streptococcus cuniculipharyngis]|uniref:Penicillin-binding protein 2 n=1 Tax=Streptococcus cuniculipharyngis TaxID=1562651 RepID=A0A5C5SFC5_9STRE|nr:penicillin-binding protein PBP2B [Streptococcus cuniculipharyngis]TWS98651.1 penicillin-binding protein 2 [Streptococcus cuniculipharyngis]